MESRLHENRRLHFPANSSDAIWLLLCLMRFMTSPWMRHKRDKNERDKLRRVLGKLTREERLVCIWKRAGFSTREIASHHHRSVGSIEKVFASARNKLRQLLSKEDARNSSGQSAPKSGRSR
jgi:DNA-directed RNA polymerase specialized sigma24 family protein